MKYKQIRFYFEYSVGIIFDNTNGPYSGSAWISSHIARGRIRTGDTNVPSFLSQQLDMMPPLQADDLEPPPIEYTPVRTQQGENMQAHSAVNSMHADAVASQLVGDEVGLGRVLIITYPLPFIFKQTIPAFTDYAPLMEQE